MLDQIATKQAQNARTADIKNATRRERGVTCGGRKRAGHRQGGDIADKHSRPQPKKHTQRLFGKTTRAMPTAKHPSTKRAKVVSSLSCTFSLSHLCSAPEFFLATSGWLLEGWQGRMRVGVFKVCGPLVPRFREFFSYLA